MADTVVDGKPTGVIVLAHTDESAAKANADKLRAAPAKGVDPRLRQPYSDQISNPKVEADGRLVVATMGLRRPRYLMDQFLQRTPLLAIG